LSLLSVVPEIGLRSDLIQFLDPLLFAFDVKDASAVYRVVAPGESIALWFLLTSAYAFIFNPRSGFGSEFCGQFEL
jgi:hypothetical protein